MDLVRLAADYTPQDLVEGYSSLIWTERFTEAGEFELTSLNKSIRAQLPVGSTCSLLDSTKVQIVETHQVEEDDQGKTVYTITGRDYETIFEGRVAAKSLAALPNNWHVTDETPAQIVIDIMRNAITSSPLSSKDVLSWVSINNYAPPDEKGDYVIEMTDAYSQMIELLGSAGLGIRSRRRPAQGFSIPPSGLDIDIYKGTDRRPRAGSGRQHQRSDDDVVMSLDKGHLKAPKYIFTRKDYRNIAYVYSKLGTRIVSAPGVSLNVSDINRQVLLVTADDIEQKSPPYTAAQLDGILKRRGLRALREYNKQFLFDCEVTLANPYVYGRDYNLGDTFIVQADYNVNRSVVLREFIRVQDEQGERAYPTLFPEG